MLADFKQTPQFAFAGMTDLFHSSLKKKCCNETAFFDQFGKSCWKCMRDYWLSSELGADILRTNNALERWNGHAKNTFTKNLLLLVNMLLGTFMTWATNECRRRANLHAHALTEHVNGKTDNKIIVRIHHV